VEVILACKGRERVREKGWEREMGTGEREREREREKFMDIWWEGVMGRGRVERGGVGEKEMERVVESEVKG